MRQTVNPPPHISGSFCIIFNPTNFVDESNQQLVSKQKTSLKGDKDAPALNFREMSEMVKHKLQSNEEQKAKKQLIEKRVPFIA